MNRAQRLDHRRAWIALAFILPALLIAALLARPRGPGPASDTPASAP